MNNHNRVQMHFEFINPQKLTKPLQNQSKPLQNQSKPLQNQPKALQPQPKPLQHQPKHLQPQIKYLQPQIKYLQPQHKYLQPQQTPLVRPTTSKYVCECLKVQPKIEINEQMVWQIEQQVKQQQQIVDEWDKEFERMRVRELEILRTDLIRELDTLIAISNNKNTSRYICSCVKSLHTPEIDNHLIEQIEQQVKQQQQIVDEWDKEFERMRVRELEMQRTDVIRELDTLIAISNYILT